MNTTMPIAFSRAFKLSFAKALQCMTFSQFSQRPVNITVPRIFDGPMLTSEAAGVGTRLTTTTSYVFQVTISYHFGANESCSTVTSYYDRLSSTISANIVNDDFIYALNQYCVEENCADEVNLIKVYLPPSIVETRIPLPCQPIILPFSLSSGTLAGLAVGGIFILVVLVVLLLCCRRLQRKKVVTEKLLEDWVESGHGDIQIVKREHKRLRFSPNLNIRDIYKRGIEREYVPSSLNPVFEDSAEFSTFMGVSDFAVDGRDRDRLRTFHNSLVSRNSQSNPDDASSNQSAVSSLVVTDLFSDNDIKFETEFNANPMLSKVSPSKLKSKTSEALELMRQCNLDFNTFQQNTAKSSLLENEPTIHSESFSSRSRAISDLEIADLYDVADTYDYGN